MNKYLLLIIIAMSLIISSSISCDKEQPDLELYAKSIELVSGGNQVGFIDAVLTGNIEIVAKDINGNVFKGQSIIFSITEGSISNTSIKTDTEGKAIVIWELGSYVGNQILTISAYETDGVTHIVGSPIEVVAKSAPHSVTDIDGNTYNVVIIGSQVWMKENLKVTKYPDGTIIPLITEDIIWGELNANNFDDAYCYYNNNTNGEADTYGALYTWAAAMGDNAVSSNNNPSSVQGISPEGWHLPSDAEWEELRDYLINNGYGYEGSGNDIGKSMAATSGWSFSSTVGTVGNDQASNNSSGFTALPGGVRGSNTGHFFSVFNSGYWWSSSEVDEEISFGNNINHFLEFSSRSTGNKSLGKSVRCIMD